MQHSRRPKTSFAYDKKYGIDKKKHREVIFKVFEIISDLIIEGDRVVIPGIGAIGVYSYKLEHNVLRYNPSQSLIERQKIIKEGKTPLVEYKDEDGNIIGDNGGVPWKVYMTFDVMNRVCINSAKFRMLDGNWDKGYRFMTARGLKRKLFHHLQNNPLGELYYEINNK